jgi:hypothetical protein
MSQPQSQLHTLTTDSRGIAVDIDDTLCETALTCMELMQSRFGSTSNTTGLELLRRYRQPGNVPEWQAANAQTWLAAQLHDENFLLSLPEVPDARASMKAIAQSLPIACYITSRVHSLQMVTEQWLQYHDFPEAPVITRDPAVHSPGWKLQYLAKLFSSLYAVIDNEKSTLETKTELAIYVRILFDRFSENKQAQSQVDGQEISVFSSWSEIGAYFNNTTCTVD